MGNFGHDQYVFILRFVQYVYVLECTLVCHLMFPHGFSLGELQLEQRFAAYLLHFVALLSFLRWPKSVQQSKWDPCCYLVSALLFLTRLETIRVYNIYNTSIPHDMNLYDTFPSRRDVYTSWRLNLVSQFSWHVVKPPSLGLLHPPNIDASIGPTIGWRTAW